MTSASLLASATVRAGLDRRHDRRKPGAADDRGHDPARHRPSAASIERVGAGRGAAIGPASVASSSAKAAFVGDHRQAGAGPASGVGQSPRRCYRSGKRNDFEIARANARSGRASTCRSSRLRQGLRPCASRQALQLRQRGENRHRDQPVQAIEKRRHDPAANGPESLTPAAALHLAFEQVPGLRRERNDRRQQRAACRLRSGATAPMPHPKASRPQRPPHSPSTVFPGLIDGASLRLPKRRPTK